MPGPIKVIAGAGSGKTRVLTMRIAHLIDSGVHKANILALTFTNKAAEEMKERIGDLVGNVGYMWIGTFHAICVKILRMEAEKLGYKSSFSIYDETDVLSLIKRILKQKGYDPDSFKPKNVRSAISKAKNEGTTPDEMFENASSTTYEIISSVYREYLSEMKKNDAMDFDDLLLNTLELLEEFPDIKEKYAKRFEHILVDEYQDTNIIQYRILHHLSSVHKSLFVVGDDDQSIYSFRGADIRNILEFEQDFPGAKTIFLEQNYRSKQSILDIANSVIKNNKNRMKKTLFSDLGKGELPLEACFEDEMQEAAFIGSKIIKARTKGISEGEIAVIYRTNAQSRVLEREMKYLGIPYKVYGGMSFFAREEIKDIAAYLNLCVNPDADISFTRIINKPKRKIGETTVQKIVNYASAERISMLEACAEAPGEVFGKTAENLKAFYAMIEEMRSFEGTLSAQVAFIAERSGLIDALRAEKTLEASARIENIQEFINGALEFEKNTEGATLADFIADNALVSDTAEDPERKTVSLMTMHSAKGLEFDVVILAGVQQGIVPHAGNIDENLEEERRLCYVGITRAKKELIITWSKRRTVFGAEGGQQGYVRSQFLEEIPENQLNIKKRKTENKNSYSSYSLKPTTTVFQKFSRQEAKPKETKEVSGINEGCKVMHAKFGMGEVKSITGSGKESIAIVKFADGEKKMFLAFAPLSIVE